MIIIVEIIFLVSLLLWFFYRKKDYIYKLPIITILFTATGIIFISTGYVLILLYGFILFYLIIKRSKTLNINIYIPILYIYMLVLVFYSSNIYNSITELHKFIFILMMYPIGYVYFQKYNHLKTLNNSVIIVGVIFIFNFIISNIFNLGVADYGFELYAGDLTRINSHIGALCVVFTPLIFTMKKRYKYFNNYFVLVIGILCLIILFLLMRRAPILFAVIGITVFMLLSNLLRKQNILITIPIILVTVFALFYWGDLILSRFEGRGMIMETNYIAEQFEREGRSREILAVNDEIFNFDNPTISLFGNEILNADYTEGRYVSYSAEAFSRLGYDRSAHTSYTRYISGTGIIGLILYLFLMIRFLFLFRNTVNGIAIKNNKQIFLIATYYALFVLAIFEWYSSSYFHLTHMPLLFLYLGAINGVLKNEQ